MGSSTYREQVGSSIYREHCAAQPALPDLSAASAATSAVLHGFKPLSLCMQPALPRPLALHLRPLEVHTLQSLKESKRT